MYIRLNSPSQTPDLDINFHCFIHAQLSWAVSCKNVNVADYLCVPWGLSLKKKQLWQLNNLFATSMFDLAAGLFDLTTSKVTVGDFLLVCGKVDNVFTDDKTEQQPWPLSISSPVDHRLCTQLLPVCNWQEVAPVHEHKEHYSQSLRWQI